MRVAGSMNQARRWAAAVFSKLVALCKQPGRGKSRHLNAESNQQQTVGVEVVGIGFTVAIDVGTVGIFRIGPEVVGLRKIVV